MMVTRRNLPFVRLITCVGAVLMLWLKVWATPITQVRVVVISFVVALVVINHSCVRVLKGCWGTPPLQEPRIVIRERGIPVLVVGIIGIVICDIESIYCAGRFLWDGVFWDISFGVAYVSGFLGLSFTWLGAYEIRVSGKTITYCSLWTGYRSLNLGDIDHARIRKGVIGRMPARRLEILPVDSARLRPLFVNLLHFRKKDMQRIFDWLGTKLQSTKY
jgi:hypothetical protein